MSFDLLLNQIHFLPLTFHRIELDQWGWAQCVSLAEMHQLICNITYLYHHMTSYDLKLRSNYDIDFLSSTCKHFKFNVSYREEHNGVRFFSLAFSVQKSSVRKNVKNSYLDLSWSLWHNQLKLAQF